MNEDLKLIKKLYGEAMMHFCRDSFSTILEEKGKLPEILQNNFAPFHQLYEDLLSEGILDNFKRNIYDLFYVPPEKRENLDVLSPQELMRQAGYILYECKTETDIQSFKKYYDKGEELCTFNGGRLNSCYVFFAVKENVDEIKRENFSNPQRQDEYGTSVISIQFSRNKSYTLSIKNRYNHRVSNPDATFGNNLDNIIEGLADSFEQFYGMQQEHRHGNFEIPGYTRANDGKWYKYNYEINNIYYCPDNIIIDNGKVIRYEKEKYIVIDYFILDLIQKRLYIYEDDFFESLLNTIGKIKKITVIKKGEEKEISIINDKGEEVKIIINKNNQIIGLKSEAIKQVWDYFLSENHFLKTLELPHLTQVGNDFLYYNQSLTGLDLPELEKAGDCFLECNRGSLKAVNLPRLRKIGDGFLCRNQSLTTLSLPNLQQIGEDFMEKNESLSVFEAPSLQQVGDFFLITNKSLVTLWFPNLVKVGQGFLENNKILNKFEAPMLQRVGTGFLYKNQSLVNLSLPSLEYAGDAFLYFNDGLVKLDLPSLKLIGEDVLYSNPSLRKEILDKLQMNNDKGRK